MVSERPPNILLVLSDQHRGDWLGNVLSALKTPNIDRLAAKGTQFSSAICPSPLCAPSRACLATARNYDRTPVRSNSDDMPADMPTFYRALCDAGYQVLSCGKLDLFKQAASWGLDGWHRGENGQSPLAAAGFTGGADSGGKHDAVMAARDGIEEPYSAFLRQHGLLDAHMGDYATRPTPNYGNCAPTPLPDFAYGDNWIGASAVELMAGAIAGDTPWFLQVNFLGPHEPMDVTSAMAARWANAELPLPSDPGEYSNEMHLEIRRRYAAMIENIDSWIGTFQAVLERTGSLADTVIVYASDHGEMLGDRGLWAKQYPFQPSLSVPLVFSGPGIRAGCVRPEPVSLIDLGPTFAQWAGTIVAGDPDGRPLQPMLTGEAGDPQDFRISGFGSWRAITDGRFKLIAGYERTKIGKPNTAADFDPDAFGSIDKLKLFDLTEDPEELTNIATSRTEITRRLADQLRAALRI